ncbi:hypothetical protein MTX35_13210 [Rhodococcus sp. ARC_M12]|uniref:hypothetical protein n=1 Tax=Rhodococcus sp. ARC_M12 TaxID=2928854 RepID=UPI001FB2DD16|nr:hypothetical protein [Rhodococcus sp. ARC_M12]MCJ0978670.1 hypothetical protein [Rhodococcus sp. ARC_M12]
MVLSETQGGAEERHEVEFWYSPFDGTRQVDAHGLLSVVSNADHWHRGPFNPVTSPEDLLAIHRRWEPEAPFHVVIDPTSQATPTKVNGKRAWEFVFPPGFWGGPLTIAFDAHTGIPLRAESTHRTEELSNVVLYESFSNDLFIVPD